jgi:hypothetical protein
LPHWIALFLDLAGIAVGLLIAPRRTFKAFVRGRRSRSLYREALTEDLLSMPVHSVRSRLHSGWGPIRATPSDAIAFVLAATAGLLTLGSLVLFLPAFLMIGLLLQ